MLKPDNGKVFQNILENYIFKYHLNASLPLQNSSYTCGRMVNSIISNLSQIDKAPILKIVSKYFIMLNKLIVSSVEDLGQKKIVKI
jgi:hypothetical protein